MRLRFQDRIESLIEGHADLECPLAVSRRVFALLELFHDQRNIQPLPFVRRWCTIAGFPHNEYGITKGRNVPFECRQDLLDHFSAHGHEFGVSIEQDYERLAEAFMFGTRGANVEECFRPQGGFARYDTVTQEYGTVDRRGFLSTYFIANPAIHGYRDNLTYFRARCR